MPGVIGLLWFLGGMSLAGVPPMNGFISKLAIVQSGTLAQEWLPLGLAVAAGVLTLTYMFRTWQHVFQWKNPDLALKIQPYGDSVLAPVLLIAVCVLLGVYSRPLIIIAEMAVAQLLDPSIYINAVGLIGA